MKNINQVTLTGVLGKPPEVRYFPSGTAVASLSLAVEENRKKGDRWEKQTTWVNVKVWGLNAQALEQTATKGTKIIVAGKLRQESWKTLDGSPRSKLYVEAAMAVIVPESKETLAAGPDAHAPEPETGDPKPGEVPSSDSDNESLPF